ncbi:MAG: phosphate/phosphite/phosphonate ABC transporter substrate-binding protein [Myxococcota bacterium]|nr:phosphate/phosphite/phosphonate ABC transporter substrate-binding protein [Myxococcota bacterium]
MFHHLPTTSSGLASPCARSAGALARVVVALSLFACVGCAEPETTDFCPDEGLCGYLPGGPSPAPRASTGGDFKLLKEERPVGREVIRLAMAPYLAPEIVRAQYEPIAHYLGSQLGMPVELNLLDSYDAVIEAAVHNKTELALLAPFSYVQARARKPDLNLLASIINQGRTRYSGFILVRADDPALGLADLKGRRIALVDRNSTSGYLLPMAALARRGYELDKHFSEVVFAGSHSRVIEMLAAGEVDAAATSSDSLGLYRREQQAAQEGSRGTELRILYKTGEVPFDALCATDAMPEEAAKKASGAFIRMHHRNPEARQALSSSQSVTGWAPPIDSRYDDIRNVLPELRPDSRGRK